MIEPTPSIWEKVQHRAAEMLERHGPLPNLPSTAWSLVNRAAIRFSGGRPAAKDRDHLMALWTTAMRSALTDLARRASARPERAGFDDAPQTGEDDCSELEDGEVLAVLQESIEALAKQDKEVGDNKALILHMRVFEGLPWKDVAGVLNRPVSSTRRDWLVARAWLRRDMRRRGVELD